MHPPCLFAAAHMARAPLLLILSAPSGGGKTTLGQRLLQTCPGLERAVTCTTRTPRPGERDGVDYHFLSPAVFGRQVRAGQFLEHATVHGHRYGTREREVTDRLARGCDVLLIIDVQGAAAVRARAAAHPALRNALVTVFLTPPSFAALEQRLRGRGTDPERAIQRRLRTARAELERWRDFDYLILSASPDDDLGRARAILTAEQLRPQRIATVNPHR